VDLTIINGQAPKDLPDVKFDKCFIGGSGGKLEEIFDYLEKALVEKGIVMGNFIKLGNLNKFMVLLKHYNYMDVEVNLIQASTMDRIGLLKGQNPIFLVKGVKANG